MVGIYGMSDILGFLVYDKQGGGCFFGGGNNLCCLVSDVMVQVIDKEVCGLVDQVYDDVFVILWENMVLFEMIVQKIFEKEVIEGDDLKQMFEVSVLLFGVIV